MRALSINFDLENILGFHMKCKKKVRNIITCWRTRVNVNEIQSMWKFSIIILLSSLKSFSKVIGKQKFSIMRGNQVWASAADENHWTFFTLIVLLKLCVTRQIYFITLSLLLFHTNQSLWLMRPFSYLFNTLHFSFNITWVYKVTTFCESVYYRTKYITVLLREFLPLQIHTIVMLAKLCEDEKCVRENERKVFNITT